MPFNLGWGEILMVLVLALLFLGPKKLPELAAGLGKMIREFRKTTADIKNEIQIEEDLRKPFDELREAVTLPAEELKRRDLWKAEWEAREKEERERAEAAAREHEAALAAAPDAASSSPRSESSSEDTTRAAPRGTSEPPSPQASSVTAPASAGEAPGTGATAGVPGLAPGATTLSDKTIASPPPGFSPPVAPPAGTVGRPQGLGSRPLAERRAPTSPAPGDRTELGLGQERVAVKSVPPPPVAARLPPPHAPGRSVPAPTMPDPDKKPA